MSKVLQGKIMLIAGIGGGIGKSLAEYFSSKVKVLITSSRSSKDDLKLRKTNLSIHKHFQLDLTKESNVVQLMKNTSEQYGKIDVVVNTIGGSLYSHPLDEFSLDEFNQVISVNLTSAFLLTKHVLKLMKENESGGNIIHMVSSSAKKFSHNKAPYGIAKAGLARLIQYAAFENAQYNIKVNGISPTYVFTERHEQSVAKKIKKTGKNREKIVEKIVSSQLLKKEMMPDDLIPVTELLCSTDVITGQIINCTLGEVINY